MSEFLIRALSPVGVGLNFLACGLLSMAWGVSTMMREQDPVMCVITIVFDIVCVTVAALSIRAIKHL
ncbi:MAG: hypothetical protein KBD06_03355 [Candidatus Pacebacteria bacterium]|nr:hypothetical protein [Candidatus Paceibacterota bacterium]